MTIRGAQGLRDYAVVAAIHVFGASYFSLFLLHYLLFHFPSTPEAIFKCLSLIFYCGGVLFWITTSFLHRTIVILGQCNSHDWQKLELTGILVLIGATTIPYIMLQYSSQPSLQIGYLCALVLALVGCVVDFIALDFGLASTRARFPYHCASLGFLSLVPVIHAISEYPPVFSPLSRQICQLAVWNALTSLHYSLRPLERIRLITEWSPSLYAMHLTLVYTAIAYSREILPMLVK